MGQWLEKFGRLPGVESSLKVLLWAENAELLKLMICMVKNDLGTEELLKLTKEPGSKTWLLFEVSDTKTPLVLEERLDMLIKGWWKSWGAEPFPKGCLEGDEVASFGWVESAAHIGIKENALLP